MPKSTPMPMNSTAKAMEMRFRAPTIARPTAAVMMSPTKVETSTATISRPERSANQRMKITASTVIAEFSAKPSLTVPNSWSSSGIWPVSRTFTPCSGVSPRPATAASTALVATSPGSRLP